MKPFGWIQPAQVAPAELMVNICLWLAAGMALSIATAWLVLDVMAIRAFTEHSAIIVLLAILWFAAALVLSVLFDRFNTWSALAGLALMSILSGLLLASLFPLGGIVVHLAITGGMYLLGAAIAHFAGSSLRGSGYYWLMALAGLLLAIAVNSLRHSGLLLWFGSIMAVLFFSAVSAYKSKSIAVSARKLYAREFTTVQSSAIRGALAIWLGVITAFFRTLELLSYLLPGTNSR
ncbi:Bax inhibitor-1 family protein [Kosakonia sacchari]|uniref:Bax inhibitor-1 family protein n=1 Tax=Kosakonia sacchari TaxID=1158459 RepID=UPI0025B15A0E|nr:Bax inhibitor-1 family protein [Kosakonia sacchari]MDN2484370.1 Bax inhibitor-1 family protein [Kosakonia sacchari]